MTAEVVFGTAARSRRLRRPRNGPRLSRVLRQLSGSIGDRRVSITDLLNIMGDRAFGALMLIFALPNVVPIPVVGISAILGLPIIYLAWQMALGWPSPQLPGWIAERSLAGSEFRTLATPMIPVVARGERLLLPRWSWMTGRSGERVIGCVCLVLAVILFLPIPLANILPAAAIALMSIGVLQKDGVAILIGLAFAATALLVAAGAVFAVFKTAVFVLLHFVAP